MATLKDQMMRLRLLGVLVFATCSAAENPPREQAPVDIHGTVFLDQNGNGSQDEGEPGVAGAAVSDQIDVVRASPSGSFRLEHSAGYGLVFVTVPHGYAAEGPFWKRLTLDAGSERVDFPLVQRGRVDDFTFLHASDTHLSKESLPRMERLRELAGALHPDFILITGDLVRDALRVSQQVAGDYFDMLVEEIAKFPVPVWTVPGNHDVFGIERQLSHVSPDHPLYGKEMYRHLLGPNYYSFTYGGVHFIGLDTIDFDDQWYYGHVDATQLAWLERDLSHVAPETTVVTFNHIPFATSLEMLAGYRETPPAPTLITVDGKTQFRHTVANAEDVLAILRQHRFPLALGGHLHAREMLAFEAGGQRTRFHQAAAVVGTNWVAGLEMVSGVTLYRVRGGEIDDGTFLPLDQPHSAAE
jgi:hypothetical protein